MTYNKVEDDVQENARRPGEDQDEDGKLTDPPNDDLALSFLDDRWDGYFGG